MIILYGMQMHPSHTIPRYKAILHELFNSHFSVDLLCNLLCNLLCQDLVQRIPDDCQHEFDKDGGIVRGVCLINDIVIFLLMVMNHGFNRKPGKVGIHPAHQQRMP